MLSGLLKFSPYIRDRATSSLKSTSVMGPFSLKRMKALTSARSMKWYKTLLYHLVDLVFNLEEKSIQVTYCFWPDSSVAKNYGRKK
jgi:hypothetical protein